MWVSGKPTEGGLTKKADKVMNPILLRPSLPQKPPSQIMQAQGLIQLPNINNPLSELVFEPWNSSRTRRSKSSRKSPSEPAPVR